MRKALFAVIGLILTQSVHAAEVQIQNQSILTKKEYFALHPNTYAPDYKAAGDQDIVDMNIQLKVAGDNEYSYILNVTSHLPIYNNEVPLTQKLTLGLLVKSYAIDFSGKKAEIILNNLKNQGYNQQQIENGVHFNSLSDHYDQQFALSCSASTCQFEALSVPLIYTGYGPKIANGVKFSKEELLATVMKIVSDIPQKYTTQSFGLNESEEIGQPSVDGKKLIDALTGAVNFKTIQTVGSSCFGGEFSGCISTFQTSLQMKLN